MLIIIRETGKLPSWGRGEYLAQLLEEKGYQVLHDTSVYDLRDGKLDRNKGIFLCPGGSGEDFEGESFHRGSAGSPQGRSGQQNPPGSGGKRKAHGSDHVFNGTSQTPDGPISYLENPNREDNLAFSFQMKLCADAFYPGYARNIYLKGLRYNLHLRPRSALVEAGAQTNNITRR